MLPCSNCRGSLVVDHIRGGGNLESTTMTKIAWRIMPFLTISYFFAILDRSNVGMASLQMNGDIGLSKAAFGFGSSTFFIAYFLFEVPSNIILKKVGARVWLARIMISWGLIAGGMAFVVGPTTYAVARFALGAAEAGFFPGVLLYMTFWIPAGYRARVIAWFMVAIPVSGFLGSQLSAWLLSLDGALGLRGWHWLFVVEGLPVAALGVACFFTLTERPEQASWLTMEEKAWLGERLRTERAAVPAGGDLSPWRLVANGYFWMLVVAGSAALGAGSVLGVWQPQLIKLYGLSDLQTGLLNSIPYGVASIVMIAWSRSSDLSRERRWHTAIPLLAIASGFGAAGLSVGLTTTLILLSCVLAGAYSFKAPFWALSIDFLSARTAAVGLAAINAIGSLIGGLTVNVYGEILERTGHTSLAMSPIAIMGVASALLVLIATRHCRDADVPVGNRPHGSAPGIVARMVRLRG